jgi:putative hemolysin
MNAKHIARLIFHTFVWIGVFVLLAAPWNPEPPQPPDDPPDGSLVLSMANPAAIYCEELGYTYTTFSSPDGDYSVCRLPDGSQCDAWDFLEGQCGTNFSLCTRLGYTVQQVRDGDNEFSPEYAVCVDQSGQVIADMTILTDLISKMAPCETGDNQALSLSFDPQSYVVSHGVTPFEVPFSFDWRNHNGANWITPVRDQRECGSCWAFSALAAAEAAMNIESGNPDLDINLSEQYLVSDCNPLGSCCGGDEYVALRYLRDYGVPDDSCMPYIDGVSCGCEGFCTGDCAYNNGLNVCSDSTCSNRCTDWSSRLVKIDGIERVPSDPTTIKQYLVKKGPLAAAYGLGSSQFGGHWDGEIYRCTNDNDANHAVLIVGYNDAGGYWIAKNSWGTSYQDDGFFKIGYGECFIERYVHSVQAYAENAPLLTSPKDQQIFSEGQQINFTWNPEESAEYYGEIKGGPQGITSFGWQITPSATMTLPAGYAYQWQVKSRTGSEESGWSSSRSFTVRPAAPGGLANAPSEPGAIKLVWQDNSQSEEGFRLYRDGSLLATLTANITTYIDSSTQAGVTHIYNVEAYRGGIASDRSNEVSASTGISGANTAAISGSVELPARPAAPDPAWITELTVSLTVSGQSGSGTTFTTTTDQSGNFIINAAPGLYNIRIKGQNTLSTLIRDVSLQNGQNVLQVGTLLAGDSNTDDYVTAVDFSILSAAYGACEGTAGYDYRADFNGDRCVSAIDFSLLASNYGKGGES